ncbi:MAG: bifunctional NADP-dependent methylenetetrahydromethanopterin dehydrogenase/methylenetetrahydrofolate dehydrogenase [Planctomycetaceae bacterium]|nr:bifunctional NADP-dependent methylenetetrahydromethanopterin dehydrogenase/methylenetetrahydrofolate dehydrogenase [Planctomycetaceae bacterium]
MRKILIQLDTDPQPSVFDRVVAMDAGVDELFSYGSVTPENVVGLVHGAIFTRGVPDLKNTAIFIGGSNVAAGEQLLAKVQKTFFGPMRVSVMMDSNGSNTTAAAAVLAARKQLLLSAAVRRSDNLAQHIESALVAQENVLPPTLSGATTLILGGTGPVGHRAAQILAAEGAEVRVGSRTRDKAEQTCFAIAKVVSAARVISVATGTDSELAEACDGVSLIIAAGAAGVELLSAERRASLKSLRIAVDLNAVPPLGIGGVEVMDKAKDRDGQLCYGAIGVGGTKMKIHRAAVARLFESNDQVLDTAVIYAIGQSL